MLATLKCQGADHVPFCPHMGQGPDYREPMFWRDQFQRANVLLELGLDPVVDIWLPDFQCHPDVKTKTWRERKGDEILLTKEFHTPAGILRQTIRESEDWCSVWHSPWIPGTFGVEKRREYGVHLCDDWAPARRTEPWVKGSEDIEKLKYLVRVPEDHVLDEWRMDTERAMEFAREYDLLTVARRTILGDVHQWLCDIPWIMMQFVDDPGFVRDLLGVFHEWSLKLIELALDADVDVIQHRGWYEIPTFWGVKWWQEFLVPLLEKQAEQVHSQGKMYSYLVPEGHGAYADGLKTMSVDVVQGIDPRMLHGGTLQDLFSKLGQGKAFWGGVNAEVTLQSQDRDTIFEAVREAVETLGANGGLVLSAFILREVPHQGTMYMIEAWRKYRDGGASP